MASYNDPKLYASGKWTGGPGVDRDTTKAIRFRGVGQAATSELLAQADVKRIANLPGGKLDVLTGRMGPSDYRVAMYKDEWAVDEALAELRFSEDMLHERLAVKRSAVYRFTPDGLRRLIAGGTLKSRDGSTIVVRNSGSYTANGVVAGVSVGESAPIDESAFRGSDGSGKEGTLAKGDVLLFDPYKTHASDGTVLVFNNKTLQELNAELAGIQQRYQDLNITQTSGVSERSYGTGTPFTTLPAGRGKQ
jgi:hypothetical protein